jgi:OmpA-OmpF porin, OOP family
MAKHFFNLLTGLFAFTSVCFAQGELDSAVVYAEGNIINAATRQPVKANIIYESQPYGNRIGTLNNNFYSFPMFDNEKYSITVQAEGFKPVKYLLDPAGANEFKRLIKDIELTAGTTPSTHVAGHLMRLNNLIFELGRSRISEESYPELELVENMMKENPNMVIQLEGHTDYQGDAKDNMKLSKERVEAVKAYLTSKGINKARVKTKAFGGTFPLSKDDTPEAHRLNRRVELRILSN